MIRKNKKALSPVVASIILIAVTVAVSIAVAVWMGGMTTSFMDTEQVEVRTVSFPEANNVTVSIRNSGATAVTIQEVWINNVDQSDIAVNVTGVDVHLPITIGANKQLSITISPYAWTAGDSYQIKVVTSGGNNFIKNAVPPT
jgi:flagellin-like protein